MSRISIAVAGPGSQPTLGSVWAVDLSTELQGRAVDAVLALPAWILLTLRESFLFAEDASDDDAGRRAVAQGLGCHDADLDILGALMAKVALPQRTTLRLEVSSSGMPGRPGYRLHTRWCAANRHPLLLQPIIDALTLRRRAEAPAETLTSSQARVIALLAEVGNELGASLQTDRRVAARLQAMVGDGIDLVGGLGSVRVEQVSSIGPRLRPSGGGWRFDVDVPGQESTEVAQRPLNVVAAGAGHALITRAGHDTTSLLEPAATHALQRASQLAQRPLSSDAVAQLVSQPEAILGEGFDLSEFSDRVVGIGPPVARSSVVLRETEPEAWWSEHLVLQLRPHDGAEPSDALDAETSADDAPSELRLDHAKATELQAKIDTADARGDAWIAIDDRLVHVDQSLRETVANALTLEATRDASGRLQRPARQVLHLHDNVESLTYDRQRALSTPPPAYDERPPSLDPSISLKPHQREGIAWLRHAHSSGAPGVLLADDMGLGKTLQVLAFLDHARAASDAGAALVVAPAGLLENWRQEAVRFFGRRFQPMLLAPTQRDFAGDFAYVRDRLISHPLVLVSYETLVRQQALLARMPWDVVIADEAHRAKNPATQTWNALAGLRARFRIAMTGTPVENGLQELWAVLEAVQPGLLGSLRDFGNAYIKPLRGATHAQQLAYSEQLHEDIRGVFLRRMKRDVLGADLPPKEPASRPVELSEEQVDRYATVIREMDGHAVLPALQALMMLSAHPDLRPHHRIELPRLAERPFPKGEALLQLCADAAASGEKVLIFAGWKALQAWIAREVEERFGVEAPIINGDVDNSTERVRIIERFSEQPGFAALVLSPRAAGVGLNITAASRVIHYTREWNPAVEDQATDRAWRMGQRRVVRVYSLPTSFGAASDEATVEERLDRLLETKRALASAFLVPVGATVVSAEELAGPALGRAHR